MLQKTNFQRFIAVNWKRNPLHQTFFNVNMVTALDSGQFSAIFFE